MKRLIAMLLSLMMLLSCCVSAMAEQSEGLPAMPDGQTPNGDAGSFGGSSGDAMPEMPDGQTPPGNTGDADSFGGSSGDAVPEMPDGQTPPGDAGSFGGSEGGGFPGGGAPAEGQLGSWSQGGKDANSLQGDDYAYDAALYVTADGLDMAKSATGRMAEGTIDDHYADGVVIDDGESGHNGILVANTGYAIRNASINMLTDADGTDTCDFSGKGAAIAAFGENANVIVENSHVHVAGVAALPLFADGGATVTVRSSALQSDGGTLYKEYLSTPDQALMVAPPWILGIMGTSRCSNMMGNDTTVNVIDSETSSGAWAVLSTDAGTRMYLNVYNSSLTLNNADESRIPIQAAGGQISESLDNPYTENYGSGYGSFVIGSAVETFAGATINAGTYVAILNGGEATYSNLEAGKTYELKNSKGETTATYEAGEDKVSRLHSDTFGFMSLQSPNRITIEKGTVLDTGYATFLTKTGYGGQVTTAIVDDAVITNGGVLIQVMDNDDATNGGMMSADDPLNTNGGMQNFIPYHREDAGFDTGDAAQDSARQTFTFTHGSYTGNIYNASGSDGLNASALEVTFGEEAEYSGAIASTAAIHVTCEGSELVKANGGFAFDDAEAAAAFAGQYQNTYFTIDEYFSIGQVANLVNDNGGNAIDIALTDGAVWNVTGTSLIRSLTISGDSRVVIPEGVVLTVDGTEYTACVLTAGSF